MNRAIPELTESQRLLVSENHNLIYHCLKIYQFYPMEDYYDVAAIGLCYAAATYYADRGTFATYARICIRNELYLSLRKKREEVSLDAIIPDTENQMTFLDMVSGNAYSLEDALCVQACRQAAASMNPRERKVIRMLADGHTQMEAARQCGYSQPQISRIYQKFKKRFYA